ncbi:MAG: hypothetical protein HZA35_01040 [Parcubacteria group bacterium]|nr:hypothetical protein [Parcubacteria group bacterium]
MEIKNDIFRQYDMRGVYPEGINEYVAYAVGISIISHLRLKKPKVLVTYDARKSSRPLMRALVYGLTEAGANVVCGGLSTTPMHMFLVAKYKYDLGIMVTASHNPAQFNGFKINVKGARPFYGEKLQAFGEVLMKKNIEYPAEAVQALQIQEKSYLSAYVDFIIKHLPRGISKKKVVIDPSHGVAGMVLKEVAKRKRLTNWIFVADTIDGDFSVHGPNPLMSDAFSKFRAAVRKYKADFGVIFDVDADRVFFLLSGYKEYVPSSVAGFLMARTYVKQIPHSKILYEVRAGTLLRDELLNIDARPTLVHVGHPYFKDGIRNEKAPFGFELSGHYYFKEFFSVDSGIFAFTKFLGAFVKEKHEFKKELLVFAKKPHSPEINYVVKDKEAAMKQVEAVFGVGNKVSHFDGLSIEAKDFYINIRPSGTEDLIRLNVEAKNKHMLRSIIKQIEKVISGS